MSGRFSGEAIWKYREQEKFEDMDFLLLEMTVGGLDLSFPISLKIRRRCWRHCSVGNGPKLRHQRKSNQIFLVAEKVPMNVGFFWEFFGSRSIIET